MGPSSSSSGQARRLARRGNDYISPFANDPVRSSRLDHFPIALADALPKEAHLPTGLFDFLLQGSFSFSNKDFVMPDNLIIPSSCSYSVMELLLQKHKYPPTSKQMALEPILLGYRAYGSGFYRLLVVNCMGNFAHYNALDITFNLDSDEVFHSVQVYDSLERVSTSNKTRSTTATVRKTSSAGKYLCCLQSFLLKFCFTSTDREEQPRPHQHTKQLRMLQRNPEYILKNAVLRECPQQDNGWDCGLFAFAVVLHLANNIPVTRDVFSSSDISRLRQGLYNELGAAGGGRC